MKKLIQGIVEFRKNLSEENRTLFAQLALGQKPNALFVACSDSRVVPNLFASTNPGDLFVLRNIGNLIPPPSEDGKETCAQAALEFSIFSLNISDIIICGHSECGAMQALIKGVDHSCYPHLASWLAHGNESLHQLQSSKKMNSALSPHNQLSQLNVLQQMEHVSRYPFILERIKQRTLRLHGWWFDIARADVYCYEPQIEQFVLIDEKEAALILERLNHS